MDLDLDGRTALVTGASAGIGRAIAKRLAAEGALVGVVARRGDALEALRAEIVGDGGRAPVPIVQDLVAEDGPERLHEAVRTELGRLDVLVNNAGRGLLTSFDTTDAEWDESLVLNYTRPRALAHRVLPEMIEAGWGRIINITGISEPQALNAALPAKAAMHSWAKGLSREVARHGVTVNCIGPGRIVSEQAQRNYTEEQMREYAAREIPAGRFGQPDELAVLATFLASPLAGYITGTVIHVDGGFSRYQF